MLAQCHPGIPIRCEWWRHRLRASPHAMLSGLHHFHHPAHFLWVRAGGENDGPDAASEFHSNAIFV